MFGALSWVELTEATSPPLRRDAAVAFDPIRRRAVLFGGRSEGRGALLDDTWEYDPATGQWSRFEVEGPGPRYGHAMVFDPLEQAVLLFGGADGLADDELSDMWVWNGERWVHREPLSEDAPGGRRFATLAYDGFGVMLFGGSYRELAWDGRVDRLRFRDRVLGDQWYWDGFGWLPVSVQGELPPARDQHVLVHDPIRRQVMMAGGRQVEVLDEGTIEERPEETLLGDTWVWERHLRRWTMSQVPEEQGPGQLKGAAAAFDGLRESVILFGGRAQGGLLSDETWEWDGVQWFERTGEAPPERSGHGLVEDTGSRQVLLIGGNGLGDTWGWDGLLGQWSQITAPLEVNRPSVRYNHAMALDEGRGRVVLFGGIVGTGPFGSPLPGDDTWIWDGVSWTEHQGVDKPPARSAHAMAYDPIERQVVLFGGTDPQAKHADTWAFRETGWSRIEVEEAPPSRTWHTMAFDGRGVLLHGGRNEFGQVLGDTWRLEGGQWTQVAQFRSGPPVWQHSMGFDPVAGEVVLFGGCVTESYVFGQEICRRLPESRTYAFGEGSWRLVDAPHFNNAPRPRSWALSSLVYDGQKLVLFGGEDRLEGERSDELWGWEGAGWQQLEVSGPPARSHSAMAFDGTGLILFAGLEGSPSLGRGAETTWRFMSPSYPPSDQVVAVAQRLRFIARAFDPSDEVLRHEAINLPEGATYDPQTQVFDWTPGLGDVGSHQVSFSATGLLGGAFASVQIDVFDANRAPVAFAQDVITLEDTPVEIALGGLDHEGEVLSFRILSPPTRGGLVQEGHVVTYTPRRDESGVDVFSFEARDEGQRVSAPAEITVRVTAVNDRPVAQAMGVDLVEDSPAQIILEAEDVDGDPVTWQIVSEPSQGSVVLEGDAATYSPARDFNGEDVFEVRPRDLIEAGEPVSVVLRVAPVNDPPVIDASAASTVRETPVVIPLQMGDPDEDVLSALISDRPAHGLAEVEGASVRYTPDPGFHGVDVLGVVAFDGALPSAPAIVEISVENVLEVSDRSVQVEEDGAIEIDLAQGRPVGQGLGFVVVNPPARGSLSQDGHRVVYRPEVDFHGADVFDYLAREGDLESETGRVVIEVTSVNDLPSAVSRSVTTPEDVAVEVVLEGADRDGDALEFVIVAPAAHGVVEVEGRRAIYTPEADYHGEDSFFYAANDGVGTGPAAQVAVVVSSVEDRPEAGTRRLTTPEDRALLVPLAPRDGDGQALTWTLIVAPVHGEVQMGPLALTYTPEADFHGEDALELEVREDGGGRGTVTVLVSVTPVNDAPRVEDMSIEVSTGQRVSFGLPVFDAEGDPVSLRLLRPPESGAVRFEGTTAFYEPEGEASGRDSFLYVASDGETESGPGRVALVFDGGGRPRVVDQRVNTGEDSSVDVPLAVIPAQEGWQFEVLEAPRSGGVVIEGGLARYTPGADFNGEDTFLCGAVKDGRLAVAGLMRVVVAPVNDAPLLEVPEALTHAAGASVRVPLDGRDVDGDRLTYAAEGLPPGLYIDPNEGLITGSLSSGAPEGSPYNATLSVSDGVLLAEAQVVWEVSHRDRPPVLLPLEPLNIVAGQSFALRLHAEDPDEDALRWSSETLPPGSTLSEGGLFEWTPTTSQAGRAVIPVSVSDDVHEVAGVIVVNVLVPVVSVDTGCATLPGGRPDAPWLFGVLLGLLWGVRRVSRRRLALVGAGLALALGPGCASEEVAESPIAPRQTVAQAIFGEASWTQVYQAPEGVVAPPTGPALGVYDTVFGELLTYHSDAGAREAQTWSFGESWARRGGAGAIPGDEPEMVFDATRGESLLIGCGSGAMWHWDGAVWVERLAPGQGPELLPGCMVAFDPARGVVVMVGYEVLRNAMTTWQWEGTSWQETGDLGAQPTDRLHGAMAYDLAAGEMLIFGGQTFNETVALDDLWAYEPLTGQWRAVSQPQTRPSKRRLAAMAWDPSLGGLVLVGGDEGGQFAEDLLWLWQQSQWVRLEPVGPMPSPRSGCALVSDEDNQRLVLLAGVDAAGGLDEVWTWNGVNLRLAFTHRDHPPERLAHGMALDEAHDQVVLFGGRGEGGFGRTFGDTWLYEGEGWRLIEADVAPPARHGHQMAYDAQRGEVVLFGGRQGEAFLTDTWGWDGVGWTSRTPLGPSPSGRTGHSMAFDGSQVVLFGSDTLRDTWLWDGVRWTPFEGEGPEAHAGHRLAREGVGGRLVMISGVLAFNRPIVDLSTWRGAGWQSQEIEVHPESAFRGVAMAFDPLRRRMVTFGGEGRLDGVALRQTAILEDALLTVVPTQGAPPQAGFAAPWPGGVLMFPTPRSAWQYQMANSPPFLGAIADRAIVAGETLVVDLVASDSDGDALRISVSGLSRGLLADDEALQIHLSPDEGQVGSHDISVEVTDVTDAPLSATVDFTLHVQAPRDLPPRAFSQEASLDEDSALTVVLRGEDPEGQEVSIFQILAPPLRGRAQIEGDNLTYTPDENFFGRDTLTFVASDGLQTSQPAVVGFTVAAVNDPPRAFGASHTTEEDRPLIVRLEGEDVDLGQALAFVVVSPPARGTLEINDGVATYTPRLDFHGDDAFVFAINDGFVDSPPASVSIEVTPTNDGPRAHDLEVQTDEDTPVVVRLSASDPDEGDEVIFALVSPPERGEVSLEGDEITFTPQVDDHGVVRFSYRARDGQLQGDVAQVEVRINPVNDAPTARGGAASTRGNEAVSVVLQGHDIDGDTLTFAVESEPVGGVVRLQGNEAFYVPDQGFEGTDRFGFRASDGLVQSEEAFVVVSVGPDVSRPVALDAQASTLEDTPVEVSLVATGGGPLAFEVTRAPLGDLRIEGEVAHYTPPVDFNGADSFAFVARGPVLVSNQAVVDIAVAPVNDAPRMSPQRVAVREDDEVGISLGAVDIEGDPVSFEVRSEAGSGLVEIVGDTARYVPRADFSGRDAFSVAASDGVDTGQAVVIEVDVVGVNDPPRLVAPAPQAHVEGSQVRLQLDAEDVDGDVLGYRVVGLPTGLSVDAATGLISGRVATGASSGSPWQVQAAVSDGHEWVTEVMVWTVEGGEGPTVFKPVPTRRVVAGEAYEVEIEALSAAGEPVAVVAVALPEGADFERGRVSWTPTLSDLGIHVLRFEAESPDGASLEVQIEVVTGDVRPPPGETVSTGCCSVVSGPTPLGWPLWLVCLGVLWFGRRRIWWVVVGLVLLTSSAQAQWIDVSPQEPMPVARFDMTVAYDASRGVVVLFGGENDAGSMDDLWEWDGEGWRQIERSEPWPPALKGHALAYDEVGQRVLLYGGLIGYEGSPRTNFFFEEIWAWDGQSWAVLPIEGEGPEGRQNHAMGFDPVSGGLMVHGGCVLTACGFDRDGFDELWVWSPDDGQWREMEQGELRPGGMVRHTLMRDEAGGRMLLWGSTGEGPLWSWTEQGWSSIEVQGPSAEIRRFAEVAFDPDLRQVWFDGLVRFDLDTSRYFSVPALGGEPRSSSEVVYDGARGHLLVFGDARGLWAHRAGHWSNQTPGGDPHPEPSRRHGHAMVTDEARGEIVLFGGVDRGGVTLDDTWVWDGGAWSWRSPEASPSPRTGLAMAFDPLRGEVVLFGGEVEGLEEAQADTWVWDGEAWSLKTPEVSPPARAGHAMAFDPGRGQVVLFGGHTYDQFGRYSLEDLWVWDGVAWASVETEGNAPRSLKELKLVYEAHIDRMSFVGATGIIWALDGARFEFVFFDEPFPNEREAPFIAYDPLRESTFLFGGAQRQPFDNSVWSFDGTAWTDASVSRSGPPSADGGDAAFDPVRGEIFLFGGDGMFLAQSWGWDGQGFEDLSPPETTLDQRSPTRRRWAAMAYDPIADHVVLYGGHNGLDLKDTWVWDVALGTWQRAFNETLDRAFVSQSSPAMAYDGQRVVLFGQGVGLWVWDREALQWEEVALDDNVPQPSRRVGHAMAPVPGGLLLFGGFDGDYHSDTWFWNADTMAWTRLDPDPHPSGRSDHVLAPLDDEGRLLLYGGKGNDLDDEAFVYDHVVGDTWIWDGAWRQVQSSCNPPVRFFAAGARDPVGGRFVLAGGGFKENSVFAPFEEFQYDDVWLFEPDTEIWRRAQLDQGLRPFSGRSMATTSDGILAFGGAGFEEDRGTLIAYLAETHRFDAGTIEVARLVSSDVFPAVPGEVLTFSVGIEDPPDGLFIEARGLPPGANFSSNTGIFSWPVPEDATGQHTLTFIASDGDTFCLEDRTVIAVGAPPVVEDLSVTTAPETPIQIVLRGTDPDSEIVGWRVLEGPSEGTIDQDEQVVIYTPSEGFLGRDRFTYVATDGTFESAPGEVLIDVLAGNRPPVAESLSVETDAGVPVFVPLAAEDPDGDEIISFAVFDGPLHGEVALLDLGAEYTPTPGYHGGDVFLYTAHDGEDESAPARVDITISPFIQDIEAQVVTGSSVTLTLVGEDDTGPPITFEVVSPPERGEAVVMGITTTYTPDEGVLGFDDFEVQGHDGVSASNIARVTVEVVEPGAPLEVVHQEAELDEDSSASVTLAVVGPVESPTFQIVSGPSYGEVVLEGAELRYTPRPDYHGPDRLVFSASDGLDESGPGFVTFTVSPVNDAPSVEGAQAEARQGQEIAIPIAASDVDGDALSLRVVGEPGKGRAAISGMVVRYAPTSGQVGEDVFEIVAVDAQSESAPAQVRVQIFGEGAPPVFEAIEDQANRSGESVSLEVRATDPDGDAVRLQASGLPPGLRLDADRSVIEGDIAQNAQEAIHGVRLEAISQDGVSRLDFDWSVIANQPPRIDVPEGLSVLVGASLLIEVVVRDADGDEVRVSIEGKPEGARFEELQLDWTPSEGQVGHHALVFEANDGRDRVFAVLDIEVRALTPEEPFIPSGRVGAQAETTCACTLPASTEKMGLQWLFFGIVILVCRRVRRHEGALR